VKKPEEAIPNQLLRSARESLGWTQEELAERLGTTGVTISRWESGITVPNRHFRQKLCSLYGRSPQDLGLLQLAPSISLTIAHPPKRKRHASPFLFNEPLTDIHEFYGRHRARETLIHRVSRQASTIIVGPGRIGKTWLIDYLRLSAPLELGVRFCIGYLDAATPSCRTITGFAREATEALGLSAQIRERGLLTLEQGLKLFRATNRVPVLCIDEFESLCKQRHFTATFFRNLRSLTRTYGLVLVLASCLPLSTYLKREEDTSSFFNIFEQITLEPFQRPEAEQFIHDKSIQAGFTPYEQRYLWRYGADSNNTWPPLRLQLVGKLLLEERGQCGGYHPDRNFARKLQKTYYGALS
jgi:transcriptional regulator with XRE-family HTH domain